MIKNKYIYLISLLLLGTLFSLLKSNTSNATDAIYVWSNNSTSISASATLDELCLDTYSYILIDQKTQTVLASKNEHEQLHPASVTKIMSILLIMENLSTGNINLTDQVPCSENAASMGGSQIWLDPRETLSVDDMLKAICVASANDCVVAMAEYIAGSESGFVQMMNDKAKELGMNDTHFVNPHGLDDPEHLTSSYDVAIMSAELMSKYPEICNYTTIWSDTLRDGKSEISNTNKLLRSYQGITGLKTGSTGLALYNISATATRDDLSLIAVVMKSTTSQIRFDDTAILLDYGFKNYEYSHYANAYEIISTQKVSKSLEDSVNLVSLSDVGAIVSIDKKDELSQNIIVNQNIQAPIVQGDILGRIEFVLDDEVLTSFDLVASNNLPKLNLLNMTSFVISTWVNLLR